MRNFKKVVLLAVFLAFCLGISTFAEVNTDYRIYSVKDLKGEGYSSYLTASVTGFEETSSLSLRIGTLNYKNDVIKEKLDGKINETDRAFFFELCAFDVNTQQKTILSNPPEIKVKLGISTGSGYLSTMGKDYHVYYISDKAEELSIVDSSTTDVSFLTDKLGVFAVVYNPYAFDMTFYDGENIYSLSPSSEITLPDEPVKDGYNFEGWYGRENGEGVKLYPGITLSETGGRVHAFWTKIPSPNDKIKLSESFVCGVTETEPVLNTQDGTEIYVKAFSLDDSTYNVMAILALYDENCALCRTYIKYIAASPKGEITMFDVEAGKFAYAKLIYLDANSGLSPLTACSEIAVE